MLTLKKGRKMNILSRLGIFASFLLVTVSAVYIYSPTNGSFAADLSLDVESAVSVAVSTDNVLMSGFPGEVVSSAPMRIYGHSNNRNGFAVFLADADDDTSLRSDTTSDALVSKTITPADINALESEDDFNTALINMLHKRCLKANLGENEWGFSTEYFDFVMGNYGHSGEEYVFPINKEWSLDDDSDAITIALQFNVIMSTRKSNTQLESNTVYHSLSTIDSNGWARTDENKITYEDVVFMAHIGSKLTSGEYKDDIRITAYPIDAILMALEPSGA